MSRWFSSVFSKFGKPRFHDPVPLPGQEPASGGGIYLLSTGREIRSTLQGVQGMCSLLDRSELSEESHRFTAMIRASTGIVLDYIQDAQDCERLSLGVMQLSIIDWEWKTWIESVRTHYETRAQAKGIRFRCEYDEWIPSSLRGDPWKLSRVIHHLLGNAVQFTAQGEVLLRVALVQDRGESVSLRFEIFDSGLGFVPQVHRQRLGTGMGLWLCEGLLALMQSRLRAAPGNEGGTIVTFLLDLQKGKASPQKTELLTEALDAPPNWRGRILFLVNEPVSQMIGESFFHSLAFDVEAVDSLSAAIEAMFRWSFRAVVVDLESFWADGEEIARRLRDLESNSQRTPIFALLPKGGSGNEEDCRRDGFTNCFRKPLNPREWMSALKD